MLNEEQRQEFLEELAFEAWLEYAEEEHRKDQQAMVEEMIYEMLLEEDDNDEFEG